MTSRFNTREEESDMSEVVAIELELPDDLARLRLPSGVHARLQELLDRQDSGVPLNDAEQEEADGLVELSELLTLLRLRAERSSRTEAASKRK
jgi:hypothetical protein